MGGAKRHCKGARKKTKWRTGAIFAICSYLLKELRVLHVAGSHVHFAMVGDVFSEGNH